MSLHSLMFGWEFPPHCEGGLGIACEGLVRGLLMHGTTISLVLPIVEPLPLEGLSHVYAGNASCTSIAAGQTNLRAYDNSMSYAVRHAGRSAQESSLYGTNLAQEVEAYTNRSVELTKEIDADIVHCHDWMTYAAGARVAQHRNIPLVSHVHATEYDRTDRHPDPWIARRERDGLRLSHRIVAVSDYTKGMLVRHYGIDPAKISVVHNGLSVDTTTPPPVLSGRKGPPLVLFLGRLTVQKNPHMFLDAAAIVHELRPDAQFVLAGDGPMLPELMQHASRVGLSGNIIFTGKVPRADIDTLYRNASCFVMPSLSEPFGLVALEAISHGVPVVLSRQSGAAEVIDHAFKVDFWDVERFADCILTILREQPLARQMRSEAPRVLQKLSWKNQAAAVRSLYQSVLSTSSTLSPSI